MASHHDGDPLRQSTFGADLGSLSDDDASYNFRELGYGDDDRHYDGDEREIAAELSEAEPPTQLLQQSNDDGTLWRAVRRVEDFALPKIPIEDVTKLYLLLIAMLALRHQQCDADLRRGAEERFMQFINDRT